MKLTEKDFSVSWLTKRNFYLTTASQLPDGYELCLEPCFEGWDVALYKSCCLVRPKICTRVPLDVDKILGVMVYGEQWEIMGEHREALQPALAIANEVVAEVIGEGGENAL